MKYFWHVLIISTIILLIGVAGIAVKLLLKKDGKFEGTCASMNPETNPHGDPCQFCGRKPEEYEGNCSREIFEKIKKEIEANQKFIPDKYL